MPLNLNPNTIRSIATHAGVGVSAILASVALIVPWEGKSNVGYADIVHVPTDCYGHTGPDVKVGVRKTDAECQTELAMDVGRIAGAIQRCIKVPVPDKSMGAFISLAYNIGSAGFCRGSIPIKLQHHDLAGACATISLYNRAGGRPVQGLTNRRASERALCEQGLTP